MRAPAELVELVERHTVAALRDGPYRPPDDGLVAALPALLDALVTGARLERPAAALGLEVTRLGERTVLHPPEPGGPPWVLLAVPDGGVGPLVEVPHPYADLHTERVALATLARAPATTLLQAGAHRVAAGPRSGPERFVRAAYPADVAVRTDALFSRVAEGLVERLAAAQVQLHGFADREGVDVVLSPGAADDGPLTARLAQTLPGRGLRVRDPDDPSDPSCADLAGRRNVQGLAARRHGAPFAHLELSRSVRDDPARRDRVADAVAEALADALA